MHVLLVEPAYYTRYPALGLLKLSAHHKARGHTVDYVRGLKPVSHRPDKIYITSLFTWAWEPVHKAVRYYKLLFPKAEVLLGGIYASLIPEHAKLSGADEVHFGVLDEVEDILPDYTLVPEWKSSIMFSARGCIRKCAFCSVPKMEPTISGRNSMRHLIWPGHKKVVLWDNNILGTSFWHDIVSELKELDLIVDFNQGLDCRLIDEDVSQELKGLRLRPIRMAYDIPSERKALERAIPALERAGFSRRNMIVYTLYNFTDSPEGFLNRLADMLEWGVVSYPMRYEPLNSLVKNKYVSPHWTCEQIEMIAKARRVLGFGGAFPPYKGLREKIVNARNFEEAFSLRPVKNKALQQVLAL